MNKNILDIYRLLVELKNEKSIPERYEKDLGRCIRHLEEIIERKDTKFNKNILGTIAVIFNSFFDPP